MYNSLYRRTQCLFLHNVPTQCANNVYMKANPLAFLPFSRAQENHSENGQQTLSPASLRVFLPFPFPSPAYASCLGWTLNLSPQTHMLTSYPRRRWYRGVGLWGVIWSSEKSPHKWEQVPRALSSHTARRVHSQKSAVCEPGQNSSGPNSPAPCSRSSQPVVYKSMALCFSN